MEPGMLKKWTFQFICMEPAISIVWNSIDDGYTYDATKKIQVMFSPSTAMEWAVDTNHVDSGVQWILWIFLLMFIKRITKIGCVNLG